MTKTNMLKNKERDLCQKFSKILTKREGYNFVRPLSDFWKGVTDNPICGCYGLWISGEGGTLTEDGKYAVDYYSCNYVHPDVEKFLKENDLYLSWYDPGTALLMMRKI